MTAMLDAHRVGLPQRDPRRGHRRKTDRPVGLLMNSFRTDCEHAALLRRKDMPARAGAVLERARNRTATQIAKRWGLARTASHMRWIDSAMDRMEARVAAPQNELFGGGR